ALGRGHYRRYDERTATMLGDAAGLLIQRWHGDLRRLRAEADGDTGRIAAALREFPGIGPTGADIFLREVQGVWPEVAPHLDRRVLDAARKAGLPGDAGKLAQLAGSRADLPRLTAALVRASHSHS
ncbi:MAG: endonuclease, partial [Actinobacteria bacterium]|nr:endonuclease [Actinomycetota bacterium]